MRKAGEISIFGTGGPWAEAYVSMLYNSKTNIYLIISFSAYLETNILRVPFTKKENLNDNLSPPIFTCVKI